RRGRGGHEPLRRHRCPRDALREPSWEGDRADPGAGHGRGNAAAPRARPGMRRALVALVLVALALPATAAASEKHPTLRELEGDLMCPTCGTTLELSRAPAANQIRRFVRARIAAGDTKSEIEDKLVAEFGRGVLASPPKEGFDLLAWVLPLLALGLGAAVMGVLV